MKQPRFLVLLDDPERGEAMLSLARDLARTHDAHLTIGIMTPVARATVAEGFARGKAVDSVAKHGLMVDRIMERLRDGVERALDPGRPSMSWRIIRSDEFPDPVPHADLLIVRGGTSMLPAARWSLRELVVETARPVLVIPVRSQPATIGNRILLAWNGSREAVRAVAAAMAVFRQAEAVLVCRVTIYGDHAGPDRPSVIARHLERRGIAVDMEIIPESELPVADQILARALVFHADLLVMGAYGHSWTHDLLFGGVSPTILDRSPIPVLVIH